MCEAGADEVLVVPLAGSCTVGCPAGTAELAGRASVFAAVSDCAYVPRDARLRLSSAAGGRFALARARARLRLPLRQEWPGQPVDPRLPMALAERAQ
jgi:5-deoxy-glucuronate isomerase